MIRTEIDSRNVSAYLSQLTGKARTIPLRKMMVVGERSVLRNFNDSGRPSKWKGLSEKTQSMNKGRRRGGKPLLDDAELRDSVKKAAIGPSNFMVFTRKHYAVFHQLGTKHIPARPFMMWQSEDTRDIEKILVNHMLGGAR